MTAIAIKTDFPPLVKWNPLWGPSDHLDTEPESDFEDEEETCYPRRETTILMRMHSRLGNTRSQRVTQYIYKTKDGRPAEKRDAKGTTRRIIYNRIKKRGYVKGGPQSSFWIRNATAFHCKVSFSDLAPATEEEIAAADIDYIMNLSFPRSKGEKPSR